MADLRIVDAPEIPTENITGEEKLPTGGSGNYSITLDSLADYTKTKKDLADNTSVDGKVNGVRQELDAHIEDLLNPHQVTKGQIGLGNVDNTADADKPVSNSTQAAIISAVSPKADKTYVDTQLTLKANKADVYTKAETYTKQESGDLVNDSVSTALTPVNYSLDLAKRGVINRYDSLLVYNLGERVVLTNGDIVKSTIDGNTNDPNVDMTGWDFGDDSVSSIDELRLKSAKKGQKVYLISVNADQGEGGGVFVSTQKTGLVDDGGTVISSPDPLLFWVRINYECITPEMFGSTNDHNADNSEILKIVALDSRPLELKPNKIYRTSKPIEFPTDKKIIGNGATITKYSASTTGITGRTNPSNNPYNYDQDCAVVFAAWYGWYKYIDISNLIIKKEPVLGADVGKVFFAPYISMSSLKNVVVKGGEYGFYGEDLWMINWNRCEAYSKCGFAILSGGTSNTWDTCWSKETKAGYSAFRIHNVTYSSMTNCCAESVGEVGNPADAAYHITSSDITLIGCGIEGLHAYNAIRIGYSWVNIINPSFIYGVHQLYKHETRVGFIDIEHADSVVFLSGGRVSLAEAAASGCVPIRVDGGTLTYDKPLWSNVLFPNETGTYKITVSNSAAILDLTDFTGKKYVSSGRSGRYWDIRMKAQFAAGLKSNKLTTENISNIRKDIYFASQNNGLNGTIANSYPFDGFNGAVLNFSDSDAGIYSNTAQLALSTSQARAFFRRANYEQALGSWYEFRTTANTTVDSNGFIKNASPIIQLFADKIELNDEAQQQEITFEKLGVGDYLIRGSTGFAQEGWYIETPKDANGNVLFSVIYTTLENGDISVKTYKKKFDLELAAIVADLEQPVDITVERWIDLRLQELPQITNETQ